MKLLTAAQSARLIKNGQLQTKVKGTPREHDFQPVVKLFDPTGAGTWLLTEIEPDDPDVAWGLADLGMGTPEFGTIDLAELRRHRGRLGLGIERDRHWRAEGPISAYIAAASAAGRIVAVPQPAAGKTRDRA